MHQALPAIAHRGPKVRTHPRTGADIVPLWVRPDGRACWPMIGASPEDHSGGQSGTGQGGQGAQGAQGGQTSGAQQTGAQGAQGGNSTGGQSTGQSGTGNAVDGQGNDLGYPKDTPVAEMNDKQQASYWRHNSRRHEGRLKDIVGDRRPEDIKKDLDELAEVRKQQQTPAEQALTERFDAGKAEGITSERRKAATAIFRGSLETNGITGDDLDELVTAFNVDGYLTDEGIDTTKITNFAKRFSTAGTANTQQQRRDYGAGQRRQGEAGRGSAGKAEAQKRFAKN